MGKKLNAVGHRYGRLTVLETWVERKSYPSSPYWSKTYTKCICDCGNVRERISLSCLRTGNTTSCGCARAEERRRRPDAHGLEDTPLYRVWCNMKSRCLNSRNKSFKNYGGRGISICPEWVNDFRAFYQWAIGCGYAEGLTIERINVNGDYKPSNCRWATRYEQARNTTRNIKLTFNDCTMCLKDWAKEIGMDELTLRDRILESGWSIERALTTPVNPRRSAAVRRVAELKKQKAPSN